MSLSLDTLFKIAEASPLLDRVEEILRIPQDFYSVISNPGHKIPVTPDLVVPDALVKLQQDSGVEIDREMNGPDDGPAPGPQSALLRDQYVPTSPARLATLIARVLKILPDSETKTELKAFLRTIPENDLKADIDALPHLVITAYQNQKTVHALVEAFARAGKISVTEDLRGPPSPYMSCRAVLGLGENDLNALKNLGAEAEIPEP